MPTDASVAPDRQLGKLFDHLEWADRRVLDSLRAMVHPDARALDLYAHVLGAEHNWLSRILERAPREKIWPELTLMTAPRSRPRTRQTSARWSPATVATSCSGWSPTPTAAGFRSNRRWRTCCCR